MASDWDYVMSSGSRSVVKAECDNGKAIGGWDKCHIHRDHGYHLFERWPLFAAELTPWLYCSAMRLKCRRPVSAQMHCDET